MKAEFDLKTGTLWAALLAALLAAGCSREGNGEPVSLQYPMAPQYHAQSQAPMQDQGAMRYSSHDPESKYDQQYNGPTTNRYTPQGQVGQRPAQGDHMQTVDRGGDSLDELMSWERQDLGARPQRELRVGAMHGPTPNQIPGGQVITTKGLLPLLQQGI